MVESCKVSSRSSNGELVKCVERNHVTMYVNEQLTLSILENHSRTNTNTHTHQRTNEGNERTKTQTNELILNRYKVNNCHHPLSVP